MPKILTENKNQLAKKASLLNLAAKTLADSLKNGNFKSLYRGQGIEFMDVREYNFGDNIRSIDWNVTARMARPFVRRYEEDKELQVFFVLDRSFSMFSGLSKRTKIQTASEAAALLVLASLYNFSAIGAVFFDGKIRFSARAKTGSEQAMMIFKHLEETEQTLEKGSALCASLNGAYKLLKKRSFVFVISDFRTTGWEESLARLAQKNDVIALRITDTLDSELPEVGTVSFVEMESGKLSRFPTSSADFKTLWFNDNRNRVEKWRKFCLTHGVYPLQISTSEDPAFALNRFFNSRSK
ncbi:DUF58 domain-containing protein [Treponema pectinovorum]|uniref:DUF58 domain-containing protein n=1 Tax=Treponema pectinovorum TaxID=164 RepID=UPI0011CB9B31|nr:DUF58 domain-containing protein [Treponema pectinovorum]